ncbi:PREDICTED: growth-regulating factor 7-like [Nelumbo nucifera]|uniref:Growth-regulating factor n=1 Tax=Nelumbo nucifera TaxID=4432 RepID=A0A1U8AWN4_NELNU|nr:PREDICTED: growth-regulating factor 7-like [Nelumbo nucifera]XP_010267410.1 PREDICTED: growth-regulating factor 7-like [Nelumbo nucifera]XP_019054534.1 PREDICTED: growth-regulating factor 7-like [Nelumbo nucifera]
MAAVLEPEETGGNRSGLKLQRTESLPHKMITTTVHPHHHSRTFPSPLTESESGRGGGGGVSGHGPTFYRRSNNGIRSMSDIFDAVAGGGGAAAAAAAVARTLQPFNSTAFKCPEGMAASLRFPFTSAQWQELERQALIYKYMMGSVAVPPDLLMPITINLSDPVVSHSTGGRGPCFNLRFSNSTDPEPGRCRRTDGKKWRCSRDVAPDQKYCERHMHRGRPRSRKPVEQQPESNNLNTRSPASACLSNLTANTNNNPESSLFLSKVSPFQINISSSSNKDPRCAEWMAKGEAVSLAASDQQLQQFMNSKVGLRTENNTCNASLASLDGSSVCNQRQTPRQFIDGWSTATRENITDTSGKSSVSLNGKLSLSSLSLFMSGGSGIGEEVDQINIGLGVMDPERDNGGDIAKTQPLSWMNPVLWVPSSPPGGPLAEVLLPSSAASPSVGSNVASPPSCYRITGNNSSCGGDLNLMSDGWGVSSDASSPRATSVSSPSCVVQKALASLSDSSGCSSPTFTTGVPKSEIALPWLNLNQSN